MPPSGWGEVEGELGGGALCGVGALAGEGYSPKTSENVGRWTLSSGGGLTWVEEGRT